VREVKKISIFFLIFCFVFTPVVAYSWNGEPAARYPEDAEAGVAKTLILVAGVLIGIPLVTWAGRKLMGPSPQEEVELGFKKQLYSSLGERVGERVKTLPDSVIDQIIVGALGGQPVSQSRVLPQPQSRPEASPGVWQSTPLPNYSNQGGVYLINASQIQEVN